MKIHTLSLHPCTWSLTNGTSRSSVAIQISTDSGVGWGEVAPLPQWSQENLSDALEQIEKVRETILAIDWTLSSLFPHLQALQLYPSVSFGFESALLSLLSPLPSFSVKSSALLMGSPPEILTQAKLRKEEGFTHAKLKVGALSLDEAAQLIYALKEDFRLRIDVNRAWSVTDSLRFFSQFPLDSFDYVEEPFDEPSELGHFPHPLAIDESFSWELIETLPILKALIYKPTLRGGLLHCLPWHEWTKKKGIDLVVGSLFESNLGLSCVASIAHRLSLQAPLGLGTYHYICRRGKSQLF